MHHSEQPDPDMAKLLGLGPTKKFPEGKLNDKDEGEIKIAIGISNGKVVINFGSPVAWIGFSAQQARQIAESLRQKSYEIGK